MKYLIIVLSLSIFQTSFAKIKDLTTKDLLAHELNTIQVNNKVSFSVVNVSNIQTARSVYYGDVEVPRGAGSGFVWDDQGHIVTNFHVIQGGSKFFVTFKDDEKQYEAKLVGKEPKKDIAVLKLIQKPGKKLVPVKPGSSKDLIVGQKTIAIGNPFGLDHTLTQGIVSATGRRIEGIGGVKIYNMIQTDASINPGNSGGPLLNSKGEVIGMNTQIISRSGTSSGLSFAVPVDTIKDVVPQLIKHGKVIRAGIGIGLLQDQYSRRITKKGVPIAYVYEGGPADKANLRGIKKDPWGKTYLGDIILKIEGKEVNSYDEIYHSLDQFKAGDSVEITYLRDKEVRTQKIKLEVFTR